MAVRGGRGGVRSRAPVGARARAHRERLEAVVAEREATHEQAVTELLAARERRAPWEERHRLQLAMWDASTALWTARREAQP